MVCVQQSDFYFFLFSVAALLAAAAVLGWLKGYECGRYDADFEDEVHF